MRNFLIITSLGPLLAACQTTSTTETAATNTTAPADTAAPAPTPTTPTADLRNTRWVLRQLGGQPVPPPTNAEPYLLLRTDELRAEGNGSCNRFFGPFELPADGQLKFGNLASTRMACASPEGNATETGFLRALTNTRTYRISGDTLRLFGEAAAQPTAVFHAVYLR